MALIVAKIIKEENNVILKDAANNIIAVVASNGTNASTYDCDEKHIYLTSKPSYRDPIDFKININVEDIVEPSGPWTQTTLLQELANNYINQGSPLFQFFTEEGNVRLADNETHNRVTATITAVKIFDTNANRREVTITNEGNETLYIKKGAGVSIINYSYLLKSGDVLHIDDYRGEIWGVWNIANGFAESVETY